MKLATLTRISDTAASLAAAASAMLQPPVVLSRSYPAPSLVIHPKLTASRQKRAGGLRMDSEALGPAVRLPSTTWRAAGFARRRRSYAYKRSRRAEVEDA